MSKDAIVIDMDLDGHPSRFVLGPLAGLELGRFVRGRPAAYVLDRRVGELHSRWLGRILGEQVAASERLLTVTGGETAKTLPGLDHLYRWLGGLGLPRDGVLVAIGGGAILDAAGMAAATWRRGVPFVAFPTTLLAMVDAAVGGKTAINAAGLKNPVGCFHPADGILADCAFLATLPRTAWRDGMAELVKTAAIGDAELFAELHARRGDLSGLLGGERGDEPVPGILGALPWQEWIGRAVRVKADLVTRDFREQGPRRALNLGHTLGHALEAWSQDGPRPLSHGQAVAVGMAVVCRIAAERGSLPLPAAVQLLEILEACALPLTAPGPGPAALEQLLAGDKKRSARAGLRWVLPERIGGRLDLDGRVTVDEILRWLEPRP